MRKPPPSRSYAFANVRGEVRTDKPRENALLGERLLYVRPKVVRSIPVCAIAHCWGRSSSETSVRLFLDRFNGKL